MNARQYYGLIGVAAVAAIAACSPLTEPTTGKMPVASRNLGKGMEISANGGGIIDLSTAAVGDSYFALSANQNALGGATGHFHQRRVRDGLVIDFSGDVTCMSV